MGKNKIVKVLKVIFVTTLMSFYSCVHEFDYVNLGSNQSTPNYEVTEDVAKVVAVNFFEKTYKNHEQLLKSENQTETTVASIKDYNNQTGIYIVNIEPTGYVLVTSNFKNVPIAAHSDSGSFELNEDSPDGLKSWLAENMLLNDVLEMEEPKEEIQTEWELLSSMPYPGDNYDDDNPENDIPGDPNWTVNYSHTVNEQYGPLLQTTWGQRYPYNTLIENNPPTGCVAVATAQIMRYHEWPNSFNWNIMPNFAFTVDTGSLEIANLMYELGLPENLDMNYTPTGSGANSQNARRTLVDNYGYSPSAIYAPYEFNTVRQEILMYNRPVYMDGYHSSETTGWWLWEQTTYSDGHAWVCDGYKKQYDIYIHNEGTGYEYSTEENIHEWLYMNWGWDKKGNGWFYNNNIWVYGVAISVGGENVNPNFQYSRKCIYYIKP